MDELERSSLARGFLFADLRDYSAFVERHGDQAGADLIRTYRDLVRAAVSAFRGAEIRTEGDSFYLAFDSPSAAVRCGLAVLEAAAASAGPDGRPIRVGIGIHAGETVQTDEGYVGSAVNIAARVCAAAGAGELLVTDAIRALTHTYLRVTFHGRGRHRLKGIAEPIALYRVTAGDLPRREPGAPFRALRARGKLAGTIVLVAVAIGASILGAALLRESLGGVAPDPDLPASLVPSATRAPSTQGSADEFPTPAEEGLLDRLPEGVAARTCERARRNLHSESVVPEVMPTVAAVTCDPDSGSSPHVVTYWEADTSARPHSGLGDHNWVDEAFFDLVGQRQIPEGDCENAEPAYQRWSVGDVRGRFLCSLTDEGDLEIVWTYDDEQIIASAIRRDNDMRLLLQWWNANRFIRSTG